MRYNWIQFLSEVTNCWKKNQWKFDFTFGFNLVSSEFWMNEGSTKKKEVKVKTIFGEKISSIYSNLPIFLCLTQMALDQDREITKNVSSKFLWFPHEKYYDCSNFERITCVKCWLLHMWVCEVLLFYFLWQLWISNVSNDFLWIHIKFG